MKIYVKANQYLAESVASQNNIPKYILHDKTVNEVIGILQECAKTVPDVDSYVTMTYTRTNQIKIYGENVMIRLRPNPRAIPGDGWGDANWVAENYRCAKLLIEAAKPYYDYIESLPGVLNVNDSLKSCLDVNIKVIRNRDSL